MKFQLQSGYILKSLSDIFDKEIDLFKGYKHILKNLSYFNIDIKNSNVEIDKSNDSVINVIANILSRGLPTMPSVYIEEYISEKLQFASKENNDIGSIDFRLNNELSKRSLNPSTTVFLLSTLD